jgi:hypothetical protein
VEEKKILDGLIKSFEQRLEILLIPVFFQQLTLAQLLSNEYGGYTKKSS